MRCAIYKNLFRQFFGQGGCIFSRQKKRLTKTSKRGGGGEETKLLCFLFARRETQKTIDQVYKCRPKEYLGREREREKERQRERETNN